MHFTQNRYLNFDDFPLDIDSSAIESVYYVKEQDYLIVWYHNKSDTPYLYDMTRDKYHEMMGASSRGRWVSQHLVKTGADFIKGRSSYVNDKLCVVFNDESFDFELTFTAPAPASVIPTWARNSITFNLTCNA